VAIVHLANVAKLAHAMPCEHGSVFSENCLITNEIIRHSSRACRHCLDDNHLIQGAYNSGKPGNLRNFFNSEKLKENSGNLRDTQRILVNQMLFFVMQSETHN